MEIAQEVAQAPAEVKIRHTRRSQSIRFLYFIFLQRCANVMCDSYVLHYVQKVMCKRIDYEPN